MSFEPKDPNCRHCRHPLSWHSELDSECPDDDGPRYDSEAGYALQELMKRTADANAAPRLYW